MNTKNTNQIFRSFLPTTMMINGKKIIILKRLKTKLSTIFSYEYHSLLIFFTSEPEKLLVKNLNECLCIYTKHCWNILLITLGSKLTSQNPTILHHPIEKSSMIAIANNIPISTGTNVALLASLV